MKILVVDDHPLVREGLHQVLKSLEEHVEVFQASTCEQAFALARVHGDLDFVLLDYHLPDMNGLDALQIFGTGHPDLPIILLSGQASTQTMRQVLQAGAAGFVSKSAVGEELLLAVRRVLDGDIYIPPELSSAPTQPNTQQTEAKPALTQRQELVLRCLLDGLPNREIASQLHVSEETVKTHVVAILRHFDAQNRTQAVVAAARVGYRPLSTE